MTYHTTPCSTCGAEMIWTISPKGRSMPVDAAPADHGTTLYHLQLITEGQHLGQLQAVKVDLLTGEKRATYVSHFETCPDARQHSSKRGAR